jgi:hypothetical protein
MENKKDGVGAEADVGSSRAEDEGRLRRRDFYQNFYQNRLHGVDLLDPRRRPGCVEPQVRGQIRGSTTSSTRGVNSLRG